MAYHAATIIFATSGLRAVRAWITDNETDDEEESAEEEEAMEETEEQRIGADGPIEESEDPDALVERNYDRMEIEETEEEYEVEEDDEPNVINDSENKETEDSCECFQNVTKGSLVRTTLTLLCEAKGLA